MFNFLSQKAIVFSYHAFSICYKYKQLLLLPVMLTVNMVTVLFPLADVIVLKPYLFEKSLFASMATNFVVANN